jgi:hypothetical protein
MEIPIWKIRIQRIRSGKQGMMIKDQVTGLIITLFAMEFRSLSIMEKKFEREGADCSFNTPLERCIE